MKVNWSAHSLRSFYLFLGTGLLSIVWTWLNWPWAGVVKWFPLPFVAYAFLASYFVKRERLRRKQLKEEVRSLCDDPTLKGDFTIDDFDLLYEVEELEQIISNLKGMPMGRRRLQTAVDAVEKQYG
jgi:hypothetical protein